MSFSQIASKTDHLHETSILRYWSDNYYHKIAFTISWLLDLSYSAMSIFIFYTIRRAKKKEKKKHKKKMMTKGKKRAMTHVDEK